VLICSPIRCVIYPDRIGQDNIRNCGPFKNEYIKRNVCPWSLNTYCKASKHKFSLIFSPQKKC